MFFNIPLLFPDVFRCRLAGIGVQAVSQSVTIRILLELKMRIINAMMHGTLNWTCFWFHLESENLDIN